jgi:hypothetical protein
MFTAPRPNLVESSDGFSVEVLGQTGLRYREGDREMFVDSEVLPGRSGMVVYRDTISKWDVPHEADIVDEAQRARILENVRRAFRFQGFDIQVL